MEALAEVLSPQFRITELEDLSPRLQGLPQCNFSCASLFFGDVGLSSVAGTPMAITVDPLLPLCLLALPTVGWGRYQQERDSVDCVHQQTVAFLPAHAWRLTNDSTGGTGVFFTEEALLARIMAVSADPHPGSYLARLRQPLALASTDAVTASALRQLQFALQIVAEAVTFNGQMPHPFLQLDDLILRCVAFILFPDLLDPDSSISVPEVKTSLGGAVRDLMDWMHAHQHTAISLTQIEQRSGYSRRTIQLGFRREVGCGPMQWLRRQRLKSAYERLQSPRPADTVTSVARSCGYLALASFSRDFSAEFGIAPSQLLRQARRLA